MFYCAPCRAHGRGPPRQPAARVGAGALRPRGVRRAAALRRLSGPCGAPLVPAEAGAPHAAMTQQPDVHGSTGSGTLVQQKHQRKE